MPQYEVVTSPGVQFPVGLVFESDALHPVMQQHVKLLRGKKSPVSPPGKTVAEVVKPDPEDLVGEDYVDDPDEAFDLAVAEAAARDKPVDNPPPKAAPKPAKTAKGPGANS